MKVVQHHKRLCRTSPVPSSLDVWMDGPGRTGCCGSPRAYRFRTGPVLERYLLVEVASSSSQWAPGRTQHEENQFVDLDPVANALLMAHRTADGLRSTLGRNLYFSQRSLPEDRCCRVAPLCLGELAGADLRGHRQLKRETRTWGYCVADLSLEKAMLQEVISKEQ